MARMAAVRAQYSKDIVTTSPERLVTMLFDRMIRDLVAAEQAIDGKDREIANRELQHAQAILVELLHSIDRDAWAGAGKLAALYVWALEQLLQANVRQDAAQVRSTRELLEGIGDAWHQASATVARPTNGARPAGGSVSAAV